MDDFIILTSPNRIRDKKLNVALDYTYILCLIDLDDHDIGCKIITQRPECEHIFVKETSTEIMKLIEAKIEYKKHKYDNEI